MQALCTLWLPWKTQQIYGTTCFTNYDRIKSLLLTQNLTWANYGYFCSDLCDMTWKICRSNHEQNFHDMVKAPQ